MQNNIKQILVLCCSIILVFVAWGVAILDSDMSISFKAIGDLHKTNSVLFFIDALPFINALFVFLYELNYKKRVTEYEEQLVDKEKQINKSAKFAQKIGQGDFSYELSNVDQEDRLVKSLVRMRENLLKTSERENEQNWIARGRDQISNILRLHNNLDDLAFDTIKSLIDYINAIQGVFYFYDQEDNQLKNIASYAYSRKKYINQSFSVGEGLIGQAAYEMQTVYRTEIPDYYISISSGILGDQKPRSILIVPLVSDEKLQGVVELASLDDAIEPLKIKFIEELSSIIAQTVFNLKVNSRTERLLQDAQEMTQELKENEEELKQNAEEMRATHDELEKTNASLEKKMQEVENAGKKMHSLLENASEIISIYDHNRKLVYESPSVTNILGYTPEEMIAGKDLERLTSKGQKQLSLLFEKLLENPKETETIQYTYLRKDNEKIYLEITGRNLLDDPAINGIILNSQDITARKKAEKEERMKSKMQALSENSLDMIVRLSLGGNFFYMNPVFETITGIPVAEAMNKKITEAGMHEDVVGTYEQIISQVKSTVEKINIEAEFPAADGNVRIMALDAIPEFNEEKELETILVVAHDITEQKRIEHEIKEKNKAITESINYAYRIQTAILPDMKTIKDYLPKSFIFYKPRDVVSGDFPWFFVKDDFVYIAVVDCTGHGVPGALLSFIGYFLLNNIAEKADDLNAGQICDMLHQGVRTTLKQDRGDANARDGMDIAFCKICMKEMKLQYAGAHRPLYQLRGGEFIEYKGDRKAIGGIPHHKKQEKDFTNHVIDMEVGDKFLFFSDGMPDQIGGENKRKYQTKKIKEMYQINHEYTMPAFHSFFEKEFYKWKGEHKQIDDILMIGLEM